jgi:disulfide bond formation protein DsbB/mono/diheme cytochrome c family protein
MASVASRSSSSSSVSQSVVRRFGLYVALLAAWVAASGSLYMSEVLEWEPCHWCWYQRILMYPLALILALGLIKKDRNLPHYALLLALPGAGASVYHILLQKVPYFKAMETCATTNPCSGDYLIRLGIPFVTIPMLALMAFIVVIAMAFLALPTALPKALPRREVAPVVAASDDDEAFVAKPLLSPAMLVGLIVIPVVALFAISGYLTNSRKPPKNSIVAPVAATAPDAGQQLYNQACASCHGPNANALVRKAFLQKSDFELLAFVKQGRTTLESEISGGQAMPAMGGPNNSGLTDDQVLKIVRFMRQTNK